MDKNILDFLGQELPSSINEIREVMDLLNSVVDDTVEKLNDKCTSEMSNRNFLRAKEFIDTNAGLIEFSNKVKKFVDELDKLEITEDEEIEQIEKEDKKIPNYENYLVDRRIEHTLYESFTHKRPCLIEIEGDKIEVKDWKDVFIKTCNYLGEKDFNIMSNFPDDPKVNGKKVIYFSRVELPTMRMPKQLNSGLYVETNLSANNIRNIIVRILNKYGINVSKFKVFLRADYSALHSIS